MAPGSITYYYPLLSDLLLEVYREAVDRFCTGRWELAEQFDDPRERLVRVIRGGVPQHSGDQLVRLLYEFSGVAVHHPGDRAVWTTLFDRQVALYQAILETGVGVGHFSLDVPVRSVARNLVALEDAYGFHVIVGGSIDYATAVGLIQSYASTATRCPLQDPAEAQAYRSMPVRTSTRS